MDAPVVSQTIATMFQGCTQTPKKFTICTGHLFGPVHYIRVAIGPHLDADEKGLQLAPVGFASHFYIVGKSFNEAKFIDDGLIHRYPFCWR